MAGLKIGDWVGAERREHGVRAREEGEIGIVSPDFPDFGKRP